MKPFRKTTQDLAPARYTPTPPGTYDMYPFFPLPPDRIALGFDALAEKISMSGSPTVTIDGFVGVLWQHFVDALDSALKARNISPAWYPVSEALQEEGVLETLVAPFLGGNDPLFGRRCPLSPVDFFDTSALRRIVAAPDASLSIVYGTGAALAEWKGILVYVDVPKNEIQFRSRTGSITNFGTRTVASPKSTYKRMYFVDWPVLNRHRNRLLTAIDIMVDGQRPEEPAVISGNDFRAGLDTAARNFIRPRPWFEPGPWGGQWIKQHVPQVNQDASNYAWSFELIAPENGIAFGSSGCVFEASFDFMMFRNHREILGTFGDRFGYEFPIRYDFLDTFRGGNLSLQCHPRPDYIFKNFGECFTQDESYYILDCKPGARVYLGFHDGVEPAEFRRELENGLTRGTEVDVERYVKSTGAHRHDLFLIPHGTVHCSGVDNLVLEISATPYIFTFKMYDWMRMDLDGTPRTVNIDRAFDNLNFERQGKKVEKELIAAPRLLQEGTDWKLVHLPTHDRHFYDVHRFEFDTAVESATEGSCHVMNVVDGDSVILETAGGMRQRFNYAETFILPAAAGHYRLVNEGTRRAMVVKTFLKPDARPFAPPEGSKEA